MENNSVNGIKYPRRGLIRGGMRTLGKVLLTLLGNVEINGKERLPKEGPMILAGNHAAVLEAVMMAVYNPGQVEFIGNGDIPFNPSYAPIVKAYSLIPINRGNLDRQGLGQALSVLEQGGILGIFPEGGIWDAGQMQAQIGAAWLSYRSQAPILPIGFGGVRDGLQKALKLQRPKLIMNVGEVIPPITLADDADSLKTSLSQSANQLLERINALVPPEDLQALHWKEDQHYALMVEVYPDGIDTSPPLPEHLQITHGEAYAHFLFNPTLIDVLVRHLNLPLSPLMTIEQEMDLDPVITAWDAILNYLKVNPGFFTYRFGIDEGLAVEKALEELRQLAMWAQENDYALTVKPIYSYRNARTGVEVTQQGGSFPRSMRAPLAKLRF